MILSAVGLSQQKKTKVPTGKLTGAGTSVSTYVCLSIKLRTMRAQVKNQHSVAGVRELLKSALVAYGLIYL